MAQLVPAAWAQILMAGCSAASGTAVSAPGHCGILLPDGISCFGFLLKWCPLPPMLAGTAEQSLAPLALSPHALLEGRGAEIILSLQQWACAQPILACRPLCYVLPALDTPACPATRWTFLLPPAPAEQILLR